MPLNERPGLAPKVVEIIQIERVRDKGYDSIADVVGNIDPSESAVLLAFRRAIRTDGLVIAS